MCNRGLASGYLHGLDVGASVFVASQVSPFVLPSSMDAPVIMVGAGTGIAPFVGFLQERLHVRKQEKAIASEDSAVGRHGLGQLFVGCRSKVEVLYEGLCREALECGALTTYSASMSREPSVEKQYVTDGVREQKALIWEALQRPNCHYYVCGDGSMADSAYEALLHCIEVGGKTSRARAVLFMDSMRAQQRYHLDVWGVFTHFQSSKRGTKKKCQNMAKMWLQITQAHDEE